jgi:hypothetical protein
VSAENHVTYATWAYSWNWPPQTARLFNNEARPADNHTVIIEFRVDDVDTEYERLVRRSPAAPR